ncbi:unnamed protein product [Pseudo-nitzschia multistriata]|uniref:Uncharacterized protein n=1 Tax=Pseudo-nitzschia multistriata TaxID=183589 RepID=A0A448YY63_9STRA|nr:unnamed protein product [Pseudo-nitzschia multistriata]
MKLSIPTIFVVALFTKDCDCFSTSGKARNTAVFLPAANSEHAENDENGGVVSRRSAVAAVFYSASASLVAAPMVSFAETSLDFSLPTYDTKMSGFGEGSESYVKKGKIATLGESGDAMMTDPGSDEKEKQAAAMRKAEEARKAALAKKLAERKALEEEAKRRAIEKKARDKERMKKMWSSDFSE